ncbi:hypothetical protein [Sutcliffiella rhizosphaerae]|uniref:hypothetical protein n=1 Tax=Sutcliffiella rhizosphaerae TaxID=2880967 RepID=UPI001E64B87E|nr:hypothetical protein [Sutcliffiella rhizosphaerae]
MKKSYINRGQNISRFTFSQIDFVFSIGGFQFASSAEIYFGKIISTNEALYVYVF